MSSPRRSSAEAFPIKASDDSEISRRQPTSFLFLIYQSTSMSHPLEIGQSKAAFVADAINKTIASLIIRCTKSDGVRDYFQLGLFGYRGTAVGNLFRNGQPDPALDQISRFAAAPLRIEQRTKLLQDHSGDLS
jgi:hypothetical protein